MDTRELADKGLKLRKELFGEEAVEQRMTAFGAFGEPLQHIINAYAYGDIWSRPGLPMSTKSLAMIAMMAAANRPAELRVHLKGALQERLHARRKSAKSCCWSRSIAASRPRTRPTARRSKCSRTRRRRSRKGYWA